MERGSRRSRRRTGRCHTRWIWITIRLLPFTTHLRLCARVWWRQRRCMWLVNGALLPRASLLALLRRRLLVHRLLLIALRRWRVLPGLLTRWWRIWITVTVLWERLAVCAIQLSVWRWVATLQDMRRDECLCLSGDWCEHTFLREALTVGAAPVLRLVES